MGRNISARQAIQEAMEELDDYSYVITEQQIYEKQGAKYALSELYYQLFDEYYETPKDIRDRELADAEWESSK
jgi:hypothetical protein